MGKPKKPARVKLIIGFIYSDALTYNKVKSLLIKKFGKIDFESVVLDFSHTDYYKKEMGDGLSRKFVSFKNLIAPSDLYKIKLYANRLEDRFSQAKERLINIDPGYLDLAKLVLASTKDYAHRIYLRKGIFAEITLSFKGVTFTPCAWAYPDYHSNQYIDIFNQIRKLYFVIARSPDITSGRRGNPKLL